MQTFSGPSSPNKWRVPLPSPDASHVFGRGLGRRIHEGGSIHLHGRLGAGKTYLVRAILEGLGHHGKVKSPTYTLVESYHLPAMAVHHFDLYRLADEEELEMLGFREYLSDGSLLLIEWPERAAHALPRPDLDLHMMVEGEGRTAVCQQATQRGERWWLG